MKEKTLSDKIQDIVRKIGMKQAEEEQNKILEKYNLTGLNKEQIQGIADLIRFVIKGHNEVKKEAIKRLKEEIGAKDDEDAQGHINEGIIDKIFGEKLKMTEKSLSDEISYKRWDKPVGKDGKDFEMIGFVESEKVKKAIKILKEEDNYFYDENIRDQDLNKEEIVEECFNYFKKEIDKIFGEKLI